MSPLAFGDQKIKRPNVSGQFYNADPQGLSAEIDEFISQASVNPSENHIDIVIAPHAGYIYSGGVAAYGFKAASQNQYSTIVILAPSHYFGFDGMSIWEQGGFQTPLGLVEVDQSLARKLIASNEKFYFEPKAFEQEHSLEVEIPFLQKTFKDFKIVPVIMGQPSLQTLREFAASLDELIGDRTDALIVVSTDLSHYHDDAFARKMDHHTIAAIKELKAETIWEECQLKTMEMCGFVPVTAALLYAKQRGFQNVDVLRYANSGDVSGDRARVVGYTSIIIYNGHKSSQKVDAVAQENKNPESHLNLQQKKRLIEIARNTIEEYIRTGSIMEVHETDPRLKLEEGAFVTIHKQGNLRGCIGDIIGRGPLAQTVRDMAISSATKDPRFSPVQEEELDNLDVEVSVLSKPKVIKEIEQITLGIHGVIISRGQHNQGVFLPQVADETGWGKEEFLSQLCVQKAHLPADAWKDPATTIEIFTADVFSEQDIELEDQ